MCTNEETYNNFTGWELIKDLPLLLVPFTSISVSDEILSAIKEKLGLPFDRFCWYSFFDNYIHANDKNPYDREKYDIYPFEMAIRTHHVDIIYGKSHELGRMFCSWNKEIKVGFLEDKEYYGYFILCK